MLSIVFSRERDETDPFCRIQVWYVLVLSPQFNMQSNAVAIRVTICTLVMYSFRPEPHK